MGVGVGVGVLDVTVGVGVGVLVAPGVIVGVAVGLVSIPRCINTVKRLIFYRYLIQNSITKPIKFY